MKHLAVLALTAVAAVGFSQSFSNPAAILIPATAPASTSGPSTPSVITVSGITDPITNITVDLFDITHTFPDDLDILLVGPTGMTVLLASDTGGSTDVAGVSLKFDDTAGSGLSDAGAWTTGTFLPTNFGTGDTFTGAGAPAGPYGATLSAFYPLNANGNWTLFIQDDAGGDIGTVAGGWQINFRTQPVPEPATMAVFGIGALALLRRKRKA